MKSGRNGARVDEPRGVPRSRRRSPESVDPRRRDARRPHEPGPTRRGPQTAPVPRPVEQPRRAKSTTQAKARAKARKAKAPKVVRPPLRQRLQERLIARLSGMDLRPQALLARIPFVVLVIGSLGIGLAITLWLSTDAAGRSYQLSGARALNEALAQQKEALERDVLQAESAPALAEAARNLGMIPSKNTAHLVQDPGGNWVVIGQPKPAEGVSPPPLNSKLPDPAPPNPPTPAPPPPQAVGAEVPTRIAVPGGIGATAPDAALQLPVQPGSLPPGLTLMPVPLQTVPLQPVPLQTVPVQPVPVQTVPVAPGPPAVPSVDPAASGAGQ